MRAFLKTTVSICAAVFLYALGYLWLSYEIQQRSTDLAQQVTYIESKLANPVVVEGFAEHPKLKHIALPWMVHAQTLHQTQQVEALGHWLEQGASTLTGYDLFMFLQATRPFMTGYSTVDIAEANSGGNRQPLSVVEARYDYRELWQACLIKLSDYYRGLPRDWVFRMEMFDWLRAECSELANAPRLPVRQQAARG